MGFLNVKTNYSGPQFILTRTGASMNQKCKDDFKESLLGQYRELIQEAILESESDMKTRLDIGRLNSKLTVITKSARYDGLNDETIDQLINEAMTPDVCKRSAA